MRNRNKKETLNLARDIRTREIIQALWRDLPGLYNEKYSRDPQKWTRNKIAELVEFAQALGVGNDLNGEDSKAIGTGAITRSFREILLGSYGLDTEAISAVEWDPLDLLFVLMNGSDSDNRSNAIEAFKSGFINLLNGLKIGKYNHRTAGGELVAPMDWTLSQETAGLSYWKDGQWNLLGGIADAPSDGKKYGRKDGAWIEIVGGGADGREVEISTAGGYIVWRYVGDVNWINLIALATLAGPSGKQVELSTSGGYIVWRYVGDVAWNNLIAMAALKGVDGKNPEMSVQGGWLCWRLVGDPDWIQLYQIPTGSDVFQMDFIFDAAGTINYPCAYALKWTAMIHQQANAPVLSSPLNTNLAQYNNFSVTADAPGIVTLTGQWL